MALTMADSMYRKQVALLLRVLPLVAQENCFALKGGTAINFFVRNMPRLSVDIDLAYLTVADRETSLREIHAALSRIQTQIRSAIPQSRVQPSTLGDTKYSIGLVVCEGDAENKINVSPALRTVVFPSAELEVVDTVKNDFGYSRMQVVSFADLYADKMVAALDRQHPCDLFDIRLLLANEGISRELLQTFLIHLVSHERPMAELLAPVRRRILHEFERGFAGMTNDPITCDDLERTREEMIEKIHSSLTEDDKTFLLSFKKGEPNWQLLPIDGADQLPSVRWKLQNLDQMNAAKKQAMINRLRGVLEI